MSESIPTQVLISLPLVCLSHKERQSAAEIQGQVPGRSSVSSFLFFIPSQTGVVSSVCTCKQHR